MSPKHKPDIGALIREGGGQIVGAHTHQGRCADCNRPIPVSNILVQSKSGRKFCQHCVAAAFVDALPKEAQHWPLQEVLEMLAGTAEERIRAICACLKYGEKRRYGHWHGEEWEISSLGASEDVFRSVVACISFPGDTCAAGLVRLLACRRALDVFEKKRFNKMLPEFSLQSPAWMILGAAEVFLVSSLSLVDKLRWLCKLKGHPDSSVRAGGEERIKRLGFNGFDDAEGRLRIQNAIYELTGAFKADELKELAKTVQRLSGIAIPGSSKEDIAAGLVERLGTPEKTRAMYEKLAQPVKDVLIFMAWRKGGVPDEQVQQALGFPVVDKKEMRHYMTRCSVVPELQGLLSCRQHYYAEHCELRLHPWLREKFLPVLPLPQKARYQGTKEPPAAATGRILSTPPAFASLLSAIDAMCHQNVIPRKKNGEPTLSGMRSVCAAAGNFEEFYPEDPDLAFMRCQTLIRLADAAPAAATPRTEPNEVLKAWMNMLVGGFDAPAGNPGRKVPPVQNTFLPSLVDCIKDVLPYGKHDQHTAACHNSLATAVKALPVGQWITVADMQEFMLYNNLALPVPACLSSAYVTVAARYGQQRMPVNAATDVLWEEPLLKSYLLALVAVGMLDAVLAPPENPACTRPGKKYLVPADGLRAVRLNALGQWYFQGGPADIFETPCEAVVSLDERRLLLRLTGNSPVLEIALKQVAQPLGGGFHRIDGGSFLKDCDSKELLERKIAALKSLLPDRLPPVWQAFFDRLITRINPLKPVKYAVLEVGQSVEFRRLLVDDRVLKSLVAMAAGDRILVKIGDGVKLKKRLRELGYFVDSF